eukprot:SAG31_NODE_740_length_12438_cov_10.788719_1_plen_280_part_00
MPCAIATAVAGRTAAASAGSHSPAENRQWVAETTRPQTFRRIAGTNSCRGFFRTSSSAFCSRRSLTRQLGETIRSAQRSRSSSNAVVTTPSSPPSSFSEAFSNPKDNFGEILRMLLASASMVGRTSRSRVEGCAHPAAARRPSMARLAAVNPEQPQVTSACLISASVYPDASSAWSVKSTEFKGRAAWFELGTAEWCNGSGNKAGALNAFEKARNDRSWRQTAEHEIDKMKNPQKHVESHLSTRTRRWRCRPGQSTRTSRRARGRTGCTPSRSRGCPRS